ncbi:ATP synthase F1 subunit gamma [Paenibacillus thiaminolyticus]|uniref:ATP synthase gamma chain n=1 Tax=Paenibacillus thiaminolyticus TaxID=49283 RepID=A0AAJ1G595_PANTH|nr:ATP synthase F1 subunit gamma [Paenibacillus thiaminolyticus]MCY9535166.1 ATP synthase F1 subunit gamma [Paenibacillus thiaminolyticus]MCY9602121.1 ATP synthase F1 subunit gamma [Paenibacillus thiaminolyticus]MCY9608820.1 ATP synthase F1 subunit gamma [Paenibacillus thiaminolyticus]MCY9615020.1 ATP synthase F1 subunit gamma [Paenibacillus thiaminolyticus]MCY9618416.1 ATP synthase F1 subunit gamma [Paenibacillus thiaminolyticus]
MAKGILEIRRQIKSVQSTRQITKAMEMVAAAKLRRAQEKAEAARPYADKLKEVVSSIAAGTQGIQHPMLAKRPVKKTGYLVITSDGGLKGGYNANVLRKVMQVINERHRSPDEYALFVIGRKGRDYFRRREMPMVEVVTELPDSPTFANIKTIAYKAVKYFEEEQYDELNLFYNEFVNAITQVPVEKRLLPLDDDALSGEATSYEYEPSPEVVLHDLLPKYAETLIYSALLDAKASEFGAQMTAMGSATKNATKMINSLTLSYNRARQAAITQEISEIVAGANAQA